uniref:Proline-rich protein n=1 Tax=Leersia perrieri TaxID=77586 RepID=A0A0D9XHT5_9ORYZ
MAAAARALLLGAVVCAAVMAVAATTDGLRVAVKCKNVNGEYETKATGEIANSGEFVVPLNAGDFHNSDDCIAQLHTAANEPCPGQEPSKIVPMSTSGTFVAVAGKTHYPSALCSSAFLCDPFHKKDFFFHNYNKPSPVPSYKPPSPVPVYKNPTPVPTYKNPTPVYSHPDKPPSTPIYHPPAAAEEMN